MGSLVRNKSLWYFSLFATKCLITFQLLDVAASNKRLVFSKKYSKKYRHERKNAKILLQNKPVMSYKNKTVFCRKSNIDAETSTC